MEPSTGPHTTVISPPLLDPSPLSPSPFMRASSDQAARPPGSFPPTRQGRALAALGIQDPDEPGHRCVHYWVTASFFTDLLVSLGRWSTDSLPWLALQYPMQATPALFSSWQPCSRQGTLSMHIRLAPSSWTFWNLPKKKNKKTLILSYQRKSPIGSKPRAWHSQLKQQPLFIDHGFLDHRKVVQSYALARDMPHPFSQYPPLQGLLPSHRKPRALFSWLSLLSCE